MPLLSVPVVPDTYTVPPTLTARLYPTRRSTGSPKSFIPSYFHGISPLKRKITMIYGPFAREGENVARYGPPDGDF